MFRKRKTAEVKKVIDVKFEVKEDLEEDKESYLAHVSEFFKRSSSREKRKIPTMDGINRFRAYVKKLPRAPQPAIPSREVWLSLWGCVFGHRIYSITCCSLEVSDAIRGVWRQCRVDLWRL